MRILVFSDIHANKDALDAVLKDSGSEFDAYWCLGDVVGYGPDPNECIERIRILPNLTCLMGNHDAAVAGYIELDTFNTEARRSVAWARENITTDNLQFINHLIETSTYSQVTLTHGSPRNPVWEYILDTTIAKINFDYFSTQICFVGHTHIPIAYFLSDKRKNIQWRLLKNGESINIKVRAILNPGSVGQPRDRDPRAAYAIFQTEDNTWEIHRVEYDVASVQERIAKAGLPSGNGQRLSEGW